MLQLGLKGFTQYIFISHVLYFGFVILSDSARDIFIFVKMTIGNVTKNIPFYSSVKCNLVSV